VSPDDFYKQDRIMRLMRALALFQAKPHGMTTRDLAERLGVTQRTAQRDLLHLQSELHIPFVQVGARWVVASDFWLRPVIFNIHEAMAMLLSARLMLRFADKDNAFAAAAYEKVAAALPDPVKAPVLETAETLSARRHDPGFLQVLTALTSAWAERRRVVITYTMEDTFEREVLPLFIEPNPTGHSCYLIAWDPKPDAPRSYRVERISAVRVLDVRFDPPMGFSIGRHLAHAWGVWTSEQPVQVELRFSPSVARRVKETTWHESQEVEDQADGSVLVRLVVAEPTELKHWVLGWGATCEVVAPPSFRQEVAQETAAMAAAYSQPGSVVRRAG
jgi:predicted DNA-binding transcriptional regulator YafY